MPPGSRVGGWVLGGGARPCPVFGAVLLAPRAGPSAAPSCLRSSLSSSALGPVFWGLRARSGPRRVGLSGGWVGGCGRGCPPSLARFALLPPLSRHQKVGAGGPEHRTIPHGEALTSSETAIGWRLNTRRRDEHLSSARERLPSKQTAKFVGHPCKRCAGAMAYRTPPRTTRRVVRWGRT